MLGVWWEGGVGGWEGGMGVGGGGEQPMREIGR